MRPSWDEYFMEIAGVVAKRSTCTRRSVGAILVKGKRLLATGYNGAPAGLVHCAEAGCLRQKMGIPSGERHELCKGLHAEQNALIQAAVHGIQVEGATCYTTLFPCVLCAKMLVNARITRIVYSAEYPDELTAAILSEAGTTTQKLALGRCSENFHTGMPDTTCSVVSPPDCQYVVSERQEEPSSSSLLGPGAGENSASAAGG